MSDRNVHAAFKRTSEQYDNVVRLARYLVLHRAELEPVLAFGALYNHRDRPADKPLSPPPPLSLGPLAGVAAHEGERLEDYIRRAFAMPLMSDQELWVQDIGWQTTDPSPVGAAMRMLYLLDYGIPHDWHGIMTGESPSDYARNMFLYDILGMYPPDFSPLRG